MFCTYDPDNDPDSGYSGADMLLQHVRQWCVYQWNPTDKYFGYVQRVAATCSLANHLACFTNDTSVDIERVQQCVETNATSVLQRQVQHLFASEVTNFPLLTIDDQPLYGAFFKTPTEQHKVLTTFAALMGLPPDDAASDQVRAAALSTLNSSIAIATFKAALGPNDASIDVKVLSLRDSSTNTHEGGSMISGGLFYVISAAGMLLSLAATTVLLRRRDSKLKHDMQTIIVTELEHGLVLLYHIVVLPSQ
ncbi:hypothetical protein DYB28_003585, partial [Aphanomyces astaci]